MPDPRPPFREHQRAFWTAVRAGVHVVEAGAEFGVASRTAWTWFGKSGGMPPLSLAPTTGRHLCLAEREEIATGLASRSTIRAIAARLHRPASTISREVKAVMRHRRSRRVGYSGRLAGIDWVRDWEYSPSRAQKHADAQLARPKQTKLALHPRLRAEVQRRLELNHSPEQISATLAIDFPDDEEMRVSHETIYVSLYVQGRGELRRDLHKRLRTGRAVRKPRRQVGERRGKIPGMINISQRPPEVADRAVPGHWEGDLITGTQNKTAIGTLVERATRYTLLLHLPHDHGADALEQAMATAMSHLPQTLRQTLTWDQGKEMANHANITAASGLDIYFCDPH